ncbi:MAG: hypothetical protein Q8J89_05680 [Caulobacter sp.]|nr:hypothetical protein [Caulobacter sp.]
MSCDAIAVTATLWLAFAAPADGATLRPAAAVTAQASPLTAEPLFADIVARAGALKTRVEGWRGQTGALDGFAAFKSDIARLVELDMKAHHLLAERGLDSDLKCILRGIAQDLPVRLGQVEAAADPQARDAALREMVWLLRDNVEVITTPATVTSGT